MPADPVTPDPVAPPSRGALSVLARIPALRWVVPAAAAAVIIGGGAVISTATADAAAPLPARSAAQLVADVHSAALTGLSGTVVQTSDLGIPSLPSVGAAPLLGGQGSSSLSSLISGTHTLRLWYAGPQRIRVALLGSLGESDIIRDGADLWIWSSTTNTAVHRTVPAGRPGGDGAAQGAVTVPLGTALPVSPQQAAAEALAALSPSTTVGTEAGVRVAGRPAYELVLQPKDSRSLVASVRIAIDSAEHVPLRVQVFAKGQRAAAFTVGFTSVDFSRPDAAEFAFNPPPGATVDRRAGGPITSGMAGGAHLPAAGSPAEAPAEGARVIGTGWTRVLVTSASGARAALGGGDRSGGGGQISRVLEALPRVSGPWGSGRLLRSALLSAVITDSGRIAVGAVPPAMLYAALGTR